MQSAADRPKSKETSHFAKKPPSYRPSLRWLVAAVVLATAIIGGTTFIWYRQKAARQATAVREVIRRGGWVFYNCQYNDQGELIAARPPGPPWLHHLLGVDFLGTVQGLILGTARPDDSFPDFGLFDHQIPVTDEALKPLSALPQLQWLSLRGTQITDAGLEYLRPLRNLRWLWLSDTAVTDRGLTVLGELTKLEKLWLDRTKITSSGLQALSRLKKLRLVSLNGTPVDDCGIESLSTLPRLERLQLHHTQCTFQGVIDALTKARGIDLELAATIGGFSRQDAAQRTSVLDLSHTASGDGDLALVARFDDLRWLYLQETRVTDAGLQHLEPLRNLSLLHLGNTAITDAGLTYLQSLPNLETLHLQGTRVTLRAIEAWGKISQGKIRIYVTPGAPNDASPEAPKNASAD